MASLSFVSGAFESYSLTMIIFVVIVAYGISRVIYLLYFHPLCRFPGPRLAAVSNTWYAYHWLSGRYPWAIESAIHQYGPVVRIAPHELVFFTPQAFTDIYSPHQKQIETFVKTDFQNRGKNLGGIIWEEDPYRHRDAARQLLPGFSSRALRNNVEPLVHIYVNYFVTRMKELGAAPSGVPLVEWTNWLAMDLSADVAWNGKMHQMRDMKRSLYLDTLLSFNSFATAIQVFKRFPWIKPVQYLFAPFGKVTLFSAMEKATRDAVHRRIKQRGETEHPDFFNYILPAEHPAPRDDNEMLHVGSLALQVMFAGWGPVADLFYGVVVLLLKEPECYEILTAEIREHFAAYDDIAPAALVSLPYLHACLEESLRLLPSNNTGLPRISPGAQVDGDYIPKGTHVQSCVWALGRHPSYFHEPLRFRPQRWLAPDHPLYDPAFAGDHLKSLYPFSLGPRACMGREMAWMEGRMFLAKVLWSFDVVMVSGQKFDLERTLLHYGFFEKPEIWVRFVPVVRDA